MKKLAIFIAVLLSKVVFACGFYPGGEDVCISFFDAKNFKYQKYATFNYSSLFFEPQNPYENSENQPNELSWFKYCKENVEINDIRILLNNLASEDINQNSKNSFIQFLYQTKNVEAINYLKFAKNCEFFNTWQEDPWERNEVHVLPKRENLINKALELSTKTKDKEIKKRYAFLAIRMAFYNNDNELIKEIYKNYFGAKNQDDIISIWALYFRAIVEKSLSLKNYYLSLVFAKSPEKRFVCWQNFSRDVHINSVLKLAKNNIEKSYILLLYGISNPEQNLSNIKKMYELNPNFDGLSFLLIREINKIEDWVLSPYYTLFNSSTNWDYWNESDSKKDVSTQNILKRVEDDRKYAKEILDFINTVDYSKIENPLFWRVAKSYLYFITKDYNSSLTEISILEKNVKPSNSIFKQIQKIKTLDLFANQKYGNAVIPEETKSFIVENNRDKRFIFACGRELEYLGNTDDAAILYASLEKFSDNYGNYNYVYFKSPKNRNQTYEDYYYNYYGYLDAMYSPEQLLSFMNKVKSGDSFTEKLVKLDVLEMNKLQDLLGTKYLRQNKLNNALNAFKILDNNYLDAQYSLWERTEHTYGSLVFKHNPFFELKYTPNFIENKENFRLNKLSITQKLIEYINKANNPKESNRDYYYFLVANCYYNMTENGNAWMMKRNYLSGENFSITDDNEEFNSANLAKFYYGKAFENAKTDRFKALCLRMQGLCEENKIEFEISSTYNYYSNPEEFFAKKINQNKFYLDLKKNYSDEYENLISNCDSFKAYFSARR